MYLGRCTDSSGIVVGEQRYYPFGETRWSTGSMFTDKLFTGQREMAGLGIYHYGARFYSPNLGRFLSADTIVPGYANPQNLNRYSYVLNSPLRYIDPTGHRPIEEQGGTHGCSDPRYCQGGQPKPNEEPKPDQPLGDPDDDGGGGKGLPVSIPDDWGFQFTLIDTQTSVNTLLNYLGWTPNGLVKFAKAMDLIAFAIDCALLVSLATLTLTGAVIGGVAGSGGGVPGIIAGAAAGALKFHEFGEGLAMPALQFGNALASIATTAGFLADASVGNSGAKIALGINSGGIDIDAEIKSSGSNTAAFLYTGAGWAPMPVAQVELSWGLQAAAVMNDFGYSPISIPDLGFSIP